MNFLRILTIFLFVAACKKTSSNSQPANHTTSLKITVTDSNGNPLQGAQVKLFLKESDILTGSNQIGKTAVSDPAGSVLFDSLQSVKYFFQASNGCLNNLITVFPFKCFDSTFNPLTALTENQAKTAILPTGSIKYINHSGNAYSLTWVEAAGVPITGGTLIANLSDNDSLFFSYEKIGEYKTKVSQLGGSYNNIRVDTLLCGQNLVIHLP